VGKEKLALGLAELLLCREPVDETLEGDHANVVGVNEARVGCGDCDDCRLVAAETHPDLHLVYRQLNRHHPDPDVRKRKALEIGVDVLRHFVINRVGLTPARGRAKVFIVREADRATVQAQNALLKTLEEPPGKTVIVLLVTAVDRLLPTTLSRCQLVRFDALPTTFVRNALARSWPDLPDEQIAWYAQCGEGSVGRALEYAQDELYGLNGRLVEGFAQLGSPRGASGGKAKAASTMRTDRLATMWTDESKALGDRYRKRDPDITETEAGRRGLKSILQLAANWYADILRVHSGEESAVLNSAWRDRLDQAAASIDVECAAQAINRVTQTERQLDLNVNTQLAIETLLNDLAQTGSRKGVLT
jgi:DNA polymerase-3 subunit delta'